MTNNLSTNVGDRVVASFWGSDQVGLVVGISATNTYSVLVDRRRVTLERGQIKRVSPCQGYQDCGLRHTPEQCEVCNLELMAKVAQS